MAMCNQFHFYGLTLISLIVGKLQKRKWENAMTIDRQSWGYRRNTNLSQFLSMDELIDTMVETVRYSLLFGNNSFGMQC